MSRWIRLDSPPTIYLTACLENLIHLVLHLHSCWEWETKTAYSQSTNSGLAFPQLAKVALILTTAQVSAGFVIEESLAILQLVSFDETCFQAV